MAHVAAMTSHLLTGLVEPVSAVLSVALLAPFLSESILQSAPVFVAGVMITVSVQELVRARACFCYCKAKVCQK